MSEEQKTEEPRYHRLLGLIAIDCYGNGISRSYYGSFNTNMTSEQSPEPSADGVPPAESEEELDLRKSMLMTQGEQKQKRT